MSSDKSKPIGSGKFSRFVGWGLILAAAGVVWMSYRNIPLQPMYVLAGWMVMSGWIAIKWGRQRIKEANANEAWKNDDRVGQSTINMIVSMFAATFVIAAIVLEQMGGQ